MSGFKGIVMDLAASIWLQPASWQDLYDRGVGVLKNASEHSFNIALNSAISRGWIYEKSGVYFCYKKTVKEVLNPAGYDIELPSDSRSEFQKEFDRWNRNQM